MKASVLSIRSFVSKVSLPFLAIAAVLALSAWGQGAQQLWNNGEANGAWDYSSQNWLAGGTTASAFSADDYAFFEDTGAGTVAIQSDGVVSAGTYVDSSRNYTFQGGAIDGIGILAKYGTGRLTLANENTFTGATSVVGGGTLELANTRALQNSKISVYGATLAVSQPGTIIGGLTFGTDSDGYGSTMYLSVDETNKTTAALTVKSGGSFSFDVNSVIYADITGFDSFPATYFLLSGAGASSIDTDNITVSVDAPSRTTTLFQQTGNSLYVTLTRDTYRDLYWEYLTPNGFQVAWAIDRGLALGVSTPLFTALDNVAAYEFFAANALNQLHGEAYVTQILLSAQLQRDFNTRLMNWRSMIANNDCCRNSACYGKNQRRYDLWGTVHATSIDRGHIGQYSGYEANTCGVTVGAEWKFSPLWFGGVAFGYDDAGMDFDDIWSQTDLRAFRASLYGGYVNSCWYGSGYLGYSKNWYETTRQIVFPGFAAIATGRNDDNIISTGLEFGKFYSWGELNIIPTIGLHYMHINSPAFTETNGESANLAMDSASYDSFRMPVGFRTNMDICICPGLVLTPEMRMFGVTEWANRGVRRWGTFADAPEAGPFYADGGGWGRNGFQFGIGLTAQLGCRVTLGFDYDCESWKEYNRHIGSAYMSYRW